MSRLPRTCINHPRIYIARGSLCADCLALDTRHTAAWHALSRRVLASSDGVCALKLDGCTRKADTTDHIVAVVDGGTDEWSNLQPACRHCNSKKSATEFRRVHTTAPHTSSGPSLG